MGSNFCSKKKQKNSQIKEVHCRRGRQPGRLVSLAIRHRSRRISDVKRRLPLLENRPKAKRLPSLRRRNSSIGRSPLASRLERHRGSFYRRVADYSDVTRGGRDRWSGARNSASEVQVLPPLLLLPLPVLVGATVRPPPRPKLRRPFRLESVHGRSKRTTQSLRPRPIATDCRLRRQSTTRQRPIRQVVPAQLPIAAA